MRFYTQQHRHYCGIDLHARSMYVCILDKSGKTLVHRKISCDPDELLQVLRPYRKGLVASHSSLDGRPAGAAHRLHRPNDGLQETNGIRDQRLESIKISRNGI